MINQLRDKGVMGQRVSPGGGKKRLDSLYTVKKESTAFFDKLDMEREGKRRRKNYTFLNCHTILQYRCANGKRAA